MKQQLLMTPAGVYNHSTTNGLLYPCRHPTTILQNKWPTICTAIHPTTMLSKRRARAKRNARGTWQCWIRGSGLDPLRSACNASRRPRKTGASKRTETLRRFHVEATRNNRGFFEAAGAHVSQTCHPCFRCAILAQLFGPQFSDTPYM